MDLDMDQESLALAIELQLQDLQHMRKGKHAVGQNPDSEVAARFMEAEFRNLASFHADRVLSRSITQAVATDGDAIVAHARQEQQAANDRALALRDSEQSGPKRRRRGSPSRGASQSRFADDVFPSAAGPSRARAGPSSAPRARVELRNCVACSTDVPVFEAIRCPCSHDYCRDCMTALFNAAISDESLFPPRCCKEPIPIDRSRPFLSASLLGLYEAKKLEHETPNKTYCYVPNCSAFIPPAFVRDDVATCVKCRSRTCTMCKGQMHTQRDCPADTATTEVLQMADVNGWQRCYSCRRLVDLNTGCNHMTCRCGAQFCYVCGVQWKQCDCAQWDENRLVARMDDIVEREQENRNVRGAERDVLLERTRQNLVQNHECANHRWKGLKQAGHCEQCDDYMPHFVYECRNCMTIACRRCRYNRL
ncbi:hypothetical protein E4U56_005241 [Claviceps arundinis]|uniref:RBR-type E3 ubiquitin transferase n=1 Tax=Claviceps arundinis TaxID=1623583 RepID=A0A9P7MLZ8_9HYPO|nr:hypothetical protein E4U56_005241 [Claviceps arundinis]